MVFLRCPSLRRAAVAPKSVATIVGFRPWCFGVSWIKMPSVKEMYIMYALVLTVLSARMIFKRKGDFVRMMEVLSVKETLDQPPKPTPRVTRSRAKEIELEEESEVESVVEDCIEAYMPKD